jgi:hypothetical protein
MKKKKTIEEICEACGNLDGLPFRLCSGCKHNKRRIKKYKQAFR